MLIPLTCLASVLSYFIHVQFCATLWTVALQAPLSMGILQERIQEWVSMALVRFRDGHVTSPPPSQRIVHELIIHPGTPPPSAPTTLFKICL